MDKLYIIKAYTDTISHFAFGPYVDEEIAKIKSSELMATGRYAKVEISEIPVGIEVTDAEVKEALPFTDTRRV